MTGFLKGRPCQSSKRRLCFHLGFSSIRICDKSRAMQHLYFKRPFLSIGLRYRLAFELALQRRPNECNIKTSRERLFGQTKDKMVRSKRHLCFWIWGEIESHYCLSWGYYWCVCISGLWCSVGVNSVGGRMDLLYSKTCQEQRIGKEGRTDGQTDRQADRPTENINVYKYGQKYIYIYIHTVHTHTDR